MTTRKLAARLGVQSPTLYWHVPNKAALVTAIADAILDQEFGDMSPPEPQQHWQDWLGELAVERFTVGHVLEEQATRPEAEALKDFDMAAFTERHPTVVAAIADYFSPGRTVDDLFRDCLDVVIAAAAITA